MTTSTIITGRRIAMWSGPRNISTALMRSWGSRPDTYVCDEPLYAAYLRDSGRESHPVADAIVARYETDWSRVARSLLGDIPEGKSIWYQKHMAHHLLPHFGREWLTALDNCFLIRDPREMLTSLAKVLPDPTVTDTGLPQQLEVFRLVEGQNGGVPPVLDSRDVLEDPRRMLDLLCDRLGVEFTEAMLSWPPGRRATDGIWAGHWYGAVEQSTSFRRYTPKDEPVPDELLPVLEDCEPYYAELYAARLGS